MGVGKLPLAGEEPTKAQQAARRQSDVRGVDEHGRQDTLTAMSGQTAIVRLLAAAVLAGALLAPTAAGALTATSIRVTGDAARARVIVQFTGAGLTGLERQVDTPDPEIGDGRALVRINGRGIRSTASPVTTTKVPLRGLRVRAAQRPGSIVVVLEALPGLFKFVQYAVSVPRRAVVIDLWKVTLDRRAAILDDGCLRLTAWSGRDGRARARGLELRRLFEGGLVVSARGAGAGGSTLAERPLIAAGGRWAGATPRIPGLPRRAMLEAWTASAKDGSLECLVQVPVRVVPSA